MQDYPCIDIIKTGEKIKSFIYSSGHTVKEVQKFLCLSRPQPVYRWMKGQVFPSVDHLYALSKMFNVHMEELIVEKSWDPMQAGVVFILYDTQKQMRKRVAAYYQKVHVNC